jgi:hypothetical protein
MRFKRDVANRQFGALLRVLLDRISPRITKQLLMVDEPGQIWALDFENLIARRIYVRAVA